MVFSFSLDEGVPAFASGSNDPFRERPLVVFFRALGTR
jgi:hypothetical protein